MGTFDAVAPPAAAIRAVEHLLAWRLDVAHVNPSSRQTMTSGGGSTTRYKRGANVRLHAISGHRDTGLTDCPGARLYALLPRIRDAVSRIGLPKLYAPRLSTGAIIAGQPASVRIVARGSRTLVWSVSVLDPTGVVVSDIPETTNDRLDVRWPATLATPGEYLVVVAASERDGTPARPAELPLLVAAPEPSPTPTPTPSSTATPTPTTTTTPTASPT
jgi:uncharacterized protein with LGFP repeats